MCYGDVDLHEYIILPSLYNHFLQYNIVDNIDYEKKKSHFTVKNCIIHPVVSVSGLPLSSTQ
jgi:hypothetical protein